MRALLVLAVAALAAGCIGSETPPAGPARLDAWPEWQVGDAWSWTVTSRASDGRPTRGVVGGEVVGVLDDRYVVRTTDSEGRVDTVEFWRSNLTLVGETTGVRFPFEPGAAWRDGRHNWTVVGLERVATPAGDFDAWHLNVTSGSAWRDEWWAPEAKAWVKARQTLAVPGGAVSVERMIEEVRLASG